MLCAHFLASLVSVVSVETLINSLTEIISAFANLESFQFSVQEFDKTNSVGLKTSELLLRQAHFLLLAKQELKLCKTQKRLKLLHFGFDRNIS